MMMEEQVAQILKIQQQLLALFQKQQTFNAETREFMTDQRSLNGMLIKEMEKQELHRKKQDDAFEKISVLIENEIVDRLKGESDENKTYTDRVIEDHVECFQHVPSPT